MAVRPDCDSKRAAAVVFAVATATIFISSLPSLRRDPWHMFLAALRRLVVGKVGLPQRRSGLLGLIGNTPLMRINSLSRATGCEVALQDLVPSMATILPELCLFYMDAVLCCRFWERQSS